MPPADYVLIEVEDTGTGMTPEIMEKIFEPFFSTKELGKGTGLGLSTVYGIIKQTGGFIYPESELGKGTVFRIFLPRHVPAEGEMSPRPPPRRRLWSRTSPATSASCWSRTRTMSVPSPPAPCAPPATRCSRPTPARRRCYVLDDIGGQIDLMVSDVVMPEMDGPALLIKVRERLPNLKVIFVSGYAEESVRQDIADDQSVEFLAKPYSLDQINSKVKEVLGKGAETLQ